MNVHQSLRLSIQFTNEPQPSVALTVLAIPAPLPQVDHASNSSEQWDEEHFEEESECSYKEDDADYCYELKKSRIERTRGLREHMKREEENLQRLRALHEEKEKEVRAIRESLGRDS